MTCSKRSVCFSPDPNISLKRDPSLWIPSLKLLILRMQRKMNSGRSFLVEEKLPFRFVGRVHPSSFRVSLKEQSSTPLSSSGLHIPVHRSYIKLYLIFVTLTIPWVKHIIYYKDFRFAAIVVLSQIKHKQR